MKEFDVNKLCSGHNLIIGESRAKDSVIREIIKRYDGSSDALVVLDYDGRFYEHYHGEAVLADFSSAESVVPDLLETLLHSIRYGADLKIFSSTMQRLLCTSKPDRGSNDAFWSNMSAAAFRQYVEYLCILYKADRSAAKYESPAEAEGQKNDLLRLGKFAGRMTDIMYHSTVCDGSSKSASNTHDFVYNYLEDYLSAFTGEGAKPFDGSLRNPGVQNSATFQCVYMSMLANGGSFFKAMELFERDGDVLSRLPMLDIRSFVSVHPAPLFFCGSKKADANRALGALMLLSAACAAHDTGNRVTVVIPDIERWDLHEALKCVKEEGFDGLSTITSFGDLRKLASLAGTDKKSLLGDLAEASDGRLWLYTTDPVCEEIFAAESDAKERRYRLNDLDGRCGAYKSRYAELDYFVLPEAFEEKKVRRRTPLSADAGKPWIETVDDREQDLIRSAVLAGLPEDLYTALKELGYVGEQQWWQRKLSYNYRAASPESYAYEVLADFFADDPSRLTSHERMKFGLSPEKTEASKEDCLLCLARYNLSLLIDVARRIIQRMQTETSEYYEYEIDEYDEEEGEEDDEEEDGQTE